MARADIVTMIPLDRAARIIGIDLYHFNTITTLRRPENNACDDIWFQFSYQRVGALGRDDLAFALKQAEELTCQYLGYHLLPQWTVNEEVRITRPASADLVNLSSKNARGQAKSIVVRNGHVIEGGVKAKTLIEAESGIFYSDLNNDGYEELCLLAVETTVTEPQEIHVYFPGYNGTDKWEIRPIDVTIEDGVANISFSRSLALLPELWERDPDEGDQWRTINGDSISNFLESADVYRVYNDPQTQAAFYREGGCNSCDGSGCVACGWTTNTGCLTVRDSRRGILAYRPAIWDSDNSRFNFDFPCGYRDPDKITVNYRSGLLSERVDHPYVEIDPMWEKAIIYYALTLVDRNWSGCENTQNIWQVMNNDLAKSDDKRSYAVSQRDLGNPLGTKFAAVRLWRMIESNRLIQGR